MRILLLAPILIVCACDVTTDSSNNAVTVEYNEVAAQNAASDIGNTAEGIGSAIGNEVDATANKVDNSGIIAHDDDGSGNNAASNEAQNKE